MNEQREHFSLERKQATSYLFYLSLALVQVLSYLQSQLSPQTQRKIYLHI